jgi:hypothetical protein
VHDQVKAISALAQLSQWPKAATAIAKTNILDHLPGLMESPECIVQFNICLILARLPKSKPAAPSPGLIFPTGVPFFYLRTAISYLLLSWGILVSCVFLLEVLGFGMELIMICTLG